MRMSSSLLASFLIPTIAAAVLAQSCGGGEMPGTNSNGGTGGGGSGGNLTSPSGGSTFSSGTGNGSGSGGSSSTGSGGSTIITGATGGASSSGNGGSTIITGATGGSTIITGATGGSTVVGTSGSLTVMAGGFTASGAWMGYASTFAGPPMASKGTVTPAMFTAGTALCAMGTIAPDPTFKSTVGISWNIGQATTAVSPVVTTGAGLMVNVGNVTGLTLALGGGSQLRVQIENIATGIRWCFPVAAQGVTMIPWGSFNTTCYDTTAVGSAPYTVGAPITAVGLVVPSSNTATIGPFNFCLTDAHQY